MLLSTIASVFSALLITQGTLAALTPQQVVAGIQVVTTLSGDANTALSLLSTSTTPPDVTSINGALVANFQKIIDNLNADVAAIKATPPINGDDVTQPIVDALGNFATIHQGLQSNVIDKHLIFAQFALTAPVAAILRDLETAIDSVASAMGDLIPSRRSDVQTDKVLLDQSISNSITTYYQVCIPSSLYPTVMPTCSTDV